MTRLNGWPAHPWIRLGIVVAFVSLTRLHSYLFFHSLVELFSVVVAGSIFVIGWNTRAFLEDHFLPALGIGYLCVAVLDGLHTLSYSGMGVFPGESANLPTQFWIAARFLESLTLFLSPFLIGKRTRLPLVLYSAGSVTAFLIASILVWDLFPTCYVDGVGLSPFKIAAEYTIVFVLIGAAFHLRRCRDQIGEILFRTMVAAILVTSAAEMVFTLYRDVFGLSNMMGHLLKLTSVMLVYEGLIQGALRRPHEILFRSLQKSQEELRGLAHRIQAAREHEREKLAGDLHDQLGDILNGLFMDLDRVRANQEGGDQVDPTQISELVRSAHEAIQFVRDYSAEVRSPVLQLLGLGPAIRDHVEDLAEDSSLTFQTEIDEGDVELDSDVQINVFRILQEALTNVLQHSEADMVRVTFRREAGEMLLEVEDNGRGLPAEGVRAGLSMGILGMRERAIAIGGQLSVGSPVKERGTLVRLRFPFGARVTQSRS